MNRNLFQLDLIQKNHIYWTVLLVQSLSRTHSTFNVQRTDVLPVLFEQRHQKVNSQMDVLNQFVFSHANMSNSNTQAQDLKWKIIFFWEKRFLTTTGIFLSLSQDYRTCVRGLEDGTWTTWSKHRRHRLDSFEAPTLQK